jgi:exopolysaccharide biosynthesis polyprenyl glycosylphosphotransferase
MSGIADESLFQRMLALERRRCERTEDHFALLLIDIDALSESLDARAVQGIVESVSSAMRETDITGWHEFDSVIGVILTALNGAGRDAVQAVVAERIRTALSLHLDEAQVQLVKISCYMFPEDGMPNRVFYSDQERKTKERKPPVFIKRALDFTGSAFAILVLLPVFLIIALLVKITSPGPVFFRQKRIGQFGKEFTFLKFRSMYVNSDPAIHKEYTRNLIKKQVNGAGGTFKIKNDPRITPLGRFLRKSSLDELPQFINVFKGEMSLVGPRPPIPYEFESYSLWHRRRIAEAKPGITGEWQVHGRSRTTFDDMVRMDLRYIRNQSLWLDLKILMKTPLAIITGDGAY